jgi:hypothetical protein
MHRAICAVYVERWEDRLVFDSLWNMFESFICGSNDDYNDDGDDDDYDVWRKLQILIFWCNSPSKVL